MRRSRLRGRRLPLRRPPRRASPILVTAPQTYRPCSCSNGVRPCLSDEGNNLRRQELGVLVAERGLRGAMRYAPGMDREAYLAGGWYPADERACRRAIEKHAADTSPTSGSWRVLVGPHAGWAYSGDAAGRTYRWLASAHPDADLVVVFGSHRGPAGPSTLFHGDGWQTPVGRLVTARTLVDALGRELDLRAEPIAPASPDNGAELHMPFVRHFFPRAELVMLGVAASEDALDIGRRVGELVRAHERDAVFVGSTDLTHYGPRYGFTPHGGGPSAVAWVRDANDAGFVEAVLAADTAEALRHAADHGSACCPGAVAAAIEAARAYGAELAPVLVDHYLSCDVQPSSSFVGYAGVVL